MADREGTTAERAGEEVVHTDGDSAIRATGVTKRYRRFAHSHKFQTLKSAFLGGDLFSALSPDQVFTALDGVDMAVRPGETYGVIGSNGAGKSTLLKIVAGTTKPTSGRVEVDGKVSALIELGAGFHPEISGRENVYINGIMLGLSKQKIRERFDEIVAFAELERFIDAPVKTYSSGMYMRLGFSIAIHVDPDVLLIDEVLAVGDEAFVHKCLDKIAEFKRRGKTILLVTHDLESVRRLCDRAMWLNDGRVEMVGDPHRIVGRYLEWVGEKEEGQLADEHRRRMDELRGEADERRRGAHGSRVDDEPKVTVATGHSSGAPDDDDATDVGEGEQGAGEEVADIGPREKSYEPGRWGNRDVAIEEVRLLSHEGEPRHVFDCGDPMVIEMVVSPRKPVEDFVFGIGVYDRNGLCCYGSNTDIEGYEAGRLDDRGTVRIVVPSLLLTAGSYYLDVAVHSRDGIPYDYQRGMWTFRVSSQINEAGVVRIPHGWEFEGGIEWRKEGERTA